MNEIIHKKLTNTNDGFQRKLILLICMFLIVFLTQFNSVKADLTESIATLILFLIITTFICAGIGWWQKRQEK